MGDRNRVRIGLSYRPARLHRPAEFIPWNRYLGSINVYWKQKNEKKGKARYHRSVHHIKTGWKVCQKRGEKQKTKRKKYEVKKERTKIIYENYESTRNSEKYKISGD